MNKMVHVFLIVVSLLSCSSLFSEDPNYREYVESKIQNFMLANDVPGVAVGLYYGGSLTTFTFGVADVESLAPITEQTIFEIGSITKVFTSTLLSSFVNEKIMVLKNKISTYIAYLQANPSNLNKINCQQLATHTSGLPDNDTIQDSCVPESVYQAFANWRPPFRIGSEYLYSNVGYNILGFTIEGATGRVLFDLFNERILQPLGMTSTFIAVPQSYLPLYAQGYNAQGLPAQRVPECLNNGAGFIRSSITDMLNFLSANLELIGPQNLINAMVFAQQPYFVVNSTLTSCLGWRRILDTKSGIAMINSNGSTNGFTSFIGMTSDKSVGIVILTNKRPSDVSTVGREILLYLAQS